MKRKLVASFSGGRTSAFMTKWLLDNCRDAYDIKVVVANTGQEHEKTLEFIRNCDLHFGFNSVWVEAEVHHGIKKASTHRIVTFDTASRDGKPFEDMISKYGIPNKLFPHCTRELKLNPIKSYLNAIGWTTGSYTTAIGIRADEQRRVRKDAETADIVYPLVDWISTDKQDINDWWDAQPFNLDIQEHQGNCTWCWKKSFKKHFRLIEESPEIYDFPRRMEALHGRTGAGSQTGESRVFFRLAISTNALFKAAEIGAVVQIDPRQINLDLDGGCSESCEMYALDEAA